MLKSVCDICGKKQTKKGEYFYIGPNPYNQELAKTDKEAAKLPDEVLCEDCYRSCLEDI